MMLFIAFYHVRFIGETLRLFHPIFQKKPRQVQDTVQL